MPQAKCPYTAEITVDCPLVALMSASLTNKSTTTSTKNPKGTTTYSFHQKVPTSSYLIALAVGALEPRKIGPRSMVWAEADVVEKAAYEFAETEAFLTAAEDITGQPYVWGNYDVLVLPPSFPYGGMENPCLTFATPTLLAGDRSLSNVVAHEIAHSWTGNLVTNRNWEHFWLNEGWTVFLERKIDEKLNGPQSRGCASIIGVADLQSSIDAFGADNPLTKLVPELRNIDPDDAFSSVPYEKGYNLLSYLEQMVGAGAFAVFLKAYIQEFKSKCLTTQDFINFITSHFQGNPDIANMDWYSWLCTPGAPPVTVSHDESYMITSQTLCSEWRALNDACVKGDSAVVSEGGRRLQGSADYNWSEWSAPTQKIPFLTCVLKTVQEDQGWQHSVLEAMDKAYGLSSTKNSEIMFRWQMMCLVSAYEPVLPQVVSFITTQGRMKFVRPLYKKLHAVKVPPKTKLTHALGRHARVASLLITCACFSWVCSSCPDGVYTHPFPGLFYR